MYNYHNEHCVSCGEFVLAGNGKYEHRPRPRVYCLICHQAMRARKSAKTAFRRAQLKIPGM